jgi:hypothetical protein
MVLGALYLLCWDYNRLKYILPFKQYQTDSKRSKKNPLRNKFPFVFFGCVFAIAVSVILINHFLYDIRPGNSLVECRNGCADNSDLKACEIFCDCIHNQGNPLDSCLAEYQRVKVLNKQ